MPASTSSRYSPNQAPQFGGVADQFAIHTLPNPIENFFGGSDADVRADQCILKLVKQLGIDLFSALESVLKPVDEAGARFFDAALQPLQESWLLLDRAK